MLGSQPRPAELQGMLGVMAMMRILSGDAAGAATRMSPGGSMMSSYEQMVQQSNWKTMDGRETASGWRFLGWNINP